VRLAPIREAGAITVTGAVTGTVPIPLLTTSLREAVEGADVIAVTVPTPALPGYAAVSSADIAAVHRGTLTGPGGGELA